MSTINDAIPLAAQAPQQPDIMANLTKMLALKNMQQQGQMQDQAMQENQIKLQQMKQSAADNATARKILDEAGGNLKVAAPKLIQALGSQALTIVDEFTKREQSLASLDETKRKTALDKMTTFSSAVDDVMSLPPAQRPQAWENKKTLLIQSGSMSQEQSAGLPIWDDELMLGKGNELKQTISDLEMRSKKAGAEKAESDAKTAAQTASGTTPMTPYQKATLNKPDYGKSVPLPPAVEAQQIRMDATKAKVTGGGAIAPEIQGGAYTGKPGELNMKVLEGLPPGEANIIKGMREGRVNMPTGMAAGKEPWVSRLRIANAYDPEFDQTNWQNRLTTRREFNTGKESDQIRSLNTLIKHLGQLWEASDALDNTGITGGTKLGGYLTNLGKEQFGSKALKSWDVAAAAAGGEIAALLKGGVPGKEEIEQQIRNFNRNDPKDAQRQAIKDTWRLAVGRLSALESQWDTAFHSPHDMKFINDTSEKVLQRMGLQPEEKNYQGHGAVAPVAASTGVDPRVKAYADKYFNGNVNAAQAAIAKQRGDR
jgi:hypothetical protein